MALKVTAVHDHGAAHHPLVLLPLLAAKAFLLPYRLSPFYPLQGSASVL